MFALDYNKLVNVQFLVSGEIFGGPLPLAEHAATQSSKLHEFLLMLQLSVDDVVVQGLEIDDGRWLKTGSNSSSWNDCAW